MKYVVKPIKYATLCVCALATTSVSAQTQSQIEKRYTAPYKQCLAENADAFETYDCVETEYQVHDGRLNQSYVMVMKALVSAAKTRLRTSQRTWLKQRDAKCGEVARLHPVDMDTWQMSCLLDETIKRTIFLENYKG
jgi:uncharacterized protein YecT (DUF1311 family)